MGSKKEAREILGVDEGADDAAIKAYREAALRTHPDKNQGDEDTKAKFHTERDKRAKPLEDDSSDDDTTTTVMLTIVDGSISPASEEAGATPIAQTKGRDSSTAPFSTAGMPATVGGKRRSFSFNDQPAGVNLLQVGLMPQL